MRYEWEANDIQPGVRYTRKDISEVHMFGYMAAREDRLLVSISLDDGMVQPPQTADEWAAMLTRARYEPANA